jgi:hypothetical protein
MDDNAPNDDDDNGQFVVNWEVKGKEDTLITLERMTSDDDLAQLEAAAIKCTTKFPKNALT